MNQFFMAVIIGLIFILTFAGFFLLRDDGSSFKRKQTEDGARKAFDRAVRTVCSLYNLEATGRTTLRFGGEEYTFDNLLLSEYGTIAVGAVYRKGDVYGAVNDDEWICITAKENGTKERFANPLKAHNGCVKFFKELYKQEKVKGGLADSFVVFPYSNCILYVTPRNANAVTPATLRERLGQEKYLANNRADVAAMKAAIEKYSVK